MLKRGLLISVLVAAALAGCEPRERLVWSPDGTTAAMVAGDGLRLCDADGRLSAVQLKDVEHVRWAGKGERLLVVQRQPLATWEAVLPYLTPAARQRVMADANAVLEEIRAWKGEMAKLEMKTAPADFAASLLYLRDRHEKELAAKFGERWKEVKDANRPLHVVRLCERKEGKVAAGAELTRTLQEIEEIRPSRDGKSYAFVAKADVLAGEDPNSLSLFSGALDEQGKLACVADDVARWFDWSPEGLLTYVAAEGPAVKQKGAARMGVLRSRKDIARVAFNANCRVRVLADGSMLLAAEDWKLPSAPRTAKEGEEMAIFRLDANGGNIRPIVAAKEQEKLKAMAYLFEPSPDGELLAVPAQGMLVYVVTLACGMVELAQAETGEQGSVAPIVPVWRTAKELCFGQPRKGAARLDIALWSVGGAAKVISKDWPVEAAKGWLIQEQPKVTTVPTQPASAPAKVEDRQ